MDAQLRIPICEERPSFFRLTQPEIGNRIWAHEYAIGRTKKCLLTRNESRCFERSSEYDADIKGENESNIGITITSDLPVNCS